jgi:CrcB protein
MKIILSIGLGSFVGGISRYLLTQFINSKFNSTFPFGTMLVNIVGCFLIGIVLGIFNNGSISNEWRLILTTGLLGGFTTFSTFSYETIYMLQHNEILNAVIYAVISIIVGVLATLFGLVVMKIL